MNNEAIKQLCIQCAHLIGSQIQCEHCGQMYCHQCAVDPEFYEGNDCPWCADISDNKLNGGKGVQNGT